MYNKLLSIFEIKKISQINTIDKFCIISIFLFPIALVAGPAIVELIVFLNILCFIFRFRNFEIYINKKLLIILGAIYFIFVLSSLLSEFKLHSLKSSFFSLRFFIFNFIVYVILQKYKFIIRGLGIFYICLILFLIFDCFIQVIFAENIFFIDRQSKFVHAGMFGDEKVLGSFLIRISTITLGLYFWFVDFNKKNLTNVFIFLIILFLGLLFTGERTALVYFSLLFLITLIFAIRSKLLSIFKILIFIIIITLIPISLYVKYFPFQQTVIATKNQIFHNNKFNFFSVKHQSFSLTAIKIFEDNMFIGGGPNNYRKLYDKYDIFENESNHPHNMFFQMISDLGLIGFFVYLLVLLSIILNISRGIIKNNISLVYFSLSFLFFINPLFPTGNFFNNWFMAIGTFALPFMYAKIKEK